MCCYTTLWNVNVRKSLYTIQSLMVSMGMSKLGCTHLIFVDSGLKVNGCFWVNSCYLPYGKCLATSSSYVSGGYAAIQAIFWGFFGTAQGVWGTAQFVQGRSPSRGSGGRSPPRSRHGITSGLLNFYISCNRKSLIIKQLKTKSSHNVTAKCPIFDSWTAQFAFWTAQIGWTAHLEYGLPQ